MAHFSEKKHELLQSAAITTAIWRIVNSGGKQNAHIMKSVCVCVCRKRLADCYLFGFYVSSPVDHSFVSCFLIGCFSFLAFECRAKKKKKNSHTKRTGGRCFLSPTTKRTNQPAERRWTKKNLKKKKRNDLERKKKRQENEEIQRKLRRSNQRRTDSLRRAGFTFCFVGNLLAFFFSHYYVQHFADFSY